MARLSSDDGIGGVHTSVFALGLVLTLVLALALALILVQIPSPCPPSHLVALQRMPFEPVHRSVVRSYLRTGRTLSVHFPNRYGAVGGGGGEDASRVARVRRCPRHVIHLERVGTRVLPQRGLARVQVGWGWWGRRAWRAWQVGWGWLAW